MIALTLNIPDWLFCMPFWAGFGLALAIFFVLVVIAARNFNPFG